MPEPKEKEPEVKLLFDMLVIDDDEVITTFCSKALTSPLFTVTTAADGAKAKKALAEKPFHIVVTDMQLPDTTGLDLIQFIKEDHPDTEVLMLTGYSDTNTTINAIKLGAYAFLSKPLNIVALKQTVNHCVERQIMIRRLKAAGLWADSLEKRVVGIESKLAAWPSDAILASKALAESLSNDLAKLRRLLGK